MPIIEEEEPIMQSQISEQAVVANVGQILEENSTNETASGMNLAMALAAERNLRGSDMDPTKNAGQVKTLMRLIEETDGVDWRQNKKREKDKDKDKNKNKDPGVGGNENEWVCCVCMDRNKGAAFIPCGHTFCRVCSRELWVNRGSCPICNRSILEILDIF